MNRWYPLAKDALGRAEVDLESDDIRMQLLRTTAAYNAADEFLDDLGAVTADDPVDVGTLTLTGGVLTSALTEITIPTVTGTAVGPRVLVQWTGSAATSRLLAWIDTTASGTPFTVITPNGTDIILPLGSPVARL